MPDPKFDTAIRLDNLVPSHRPLRPVLPRGRCVTFLWGCEFVLVVLVPVTFLLMTLVAASVWGSWRRGIVFAFVGICAWWVVLNEALSLFGALTRLWVGLGYVVAAGILSIAVVRRPPPRPHLEPWTASPWCWVVGVLAAVLAMVALVAAPNNFDSMAYHLPKVEQWIALGGIKNFPAEYLPQIYLAPLSESAIVDLHLLAGTDRYDNLVQWLAYLVSLVSVTVISENLGATHRAQVYTLVVAATVPMAVAQAVTTQNDLLFTALLLVAAVAATEGSTTPTRPSVPLVVCTLAVGLAIATKPTALVFGVPILVWAFLRRSVQGRIAWQRALVVAPLIALLLVLPSLGWTLRNMATFGHPLGNHEVPVMTVEDWSVPEVLANTLRVASYNLGVPAPEVLNETTTTTIAQLITTLGVDPNSTGAAAAEYIRGLGVSEVGIGPGMYHWEYPFLRTLNGNTHDIRPIHVDVQNSSSKWATTDRPAVVVCECRRPVPQGTSVSYFGPLQVEVTDGAATVS